MFTGFASSLVDVGDKKAGLRIACPVLVRWSARDALDTWYADASGPLRIWREWATDVRGRAMAAGHFFPAHNSDGTADELRAFVGGAAGGPG